MQFITAEELEQRIESACMRDKWYFGEPVALHAWTKRPLLGFCGIGPIKSIQGDQPRSWFDVYVGPNGELAPEMNVMLGISCDRVGLPFVSL